MVEIGCICWDGRTQGDVVHICGKIPEIYTLSVSGLGKGWTEMGVLEGGKEMIGGGTSKGRSSTLKQVKGLPLEGGVRGTVGPEELGVELIRRIKLREDGGLCIQRSHSGEGAKAYVEKRMRRRDWR